MRVWPLASGDQVLGANHCKLLSLRAMVVSVAERTGRYPVHGEVWRDERKQTADELPKSYR